jgi:type I restriction enzyme M protein
VMANPPFNVDLVDAERIKTDSRLPFGLPGANKQKKVGNGSYLWISYFWSYLNQKGRAGFVMSSQASSAGHGEKDVRRKIVETGDVAVMISIRSNFFYTRTVPCELWFFDRAKPAEHRGKVLMLDARNIYRKVTRKIYDFSPEQMKNLSAIVWLYRGQQERFLALVKDYLGRVCAESAAVPVTLELFETTLTESLLARHRQGTLRLSRMGNASAWGRERSICGPIPRRSIRISFATSFWYLRSKECCWRAKRVQPRST